MQLSNSAAGGIPCQALTESDTLNIQRKASTVLIVGRKSLHLLMNVCACVCEPVYAAGSVCRHRCFIVVQSAEKEQSHAFETQGEGPLLFSSIVHGSV